MFFQQVRYAAIWCLVFLGSSAVLVSEGTVRQPYTSPVIRTAQADAVNPETGSLTSVLPVYFNVRVAELFLAPASLSSGTHSNATSLRAAPLFPGGGLRVTFDVPNPGLDFVMNLSAARSPLLRDVFGNLWRPTASLIVTVVKQNSRYTYDVGHISLRSYLSQSESMQVLAGEPQDDAQCLTTNACCTGEGSSYRKYALVKSPVPPYSCTEAPIPYKLKYFSFDVDGAIITQRVLGRVSCTLQQNQVDGEAVRCATDGPVQLAGMAVNPPFNNAPSKFFALCRQGSSLTDAEYEAAPIPVAYGAFCTTSQCIRYTPENYRTDRGACLDYPLGYYTSADGNNSNQLSSYERDAASLRKITLSGCSWIDDVTMASPSTIQAISFQCDVPASSGWSLSFGNFSLPITETFVPLFPIGRPTRVSARFSSPASTDFIDIEVEYVPFSNFTAGNWTLRVCSTTKCAVAAAPMTSNAKQYPTVLSASFSTSFLQLGASSAVESTVQVEVFSRSTPTSSPFHQLLAPSTVAVARAVEPTRRETVNVSLARDPPQRVPSPYAAATGGAVASRILCEGDYRFSAALNDCVPLSDSDCAVKHHGRRTRFDSTAKACVCTVPVLDGPLASRPLPDPEPPRAYTSAELRARLASTALPQFLTTMEKTFAAYDAIVAASGGGKAAWPATMPAPVASGAWSATAAASAPAPVDDDSGRVTYTNASSLSAARAISICGFVLAGVAWTVLLLRDVLCKFFALGPWEGERRYSALVDGVRYCRGLYARWRRSSRRVSSTSLLPDPPGATLRGRRGHATGCPRGRRGSSTAAAAAGPASPSGAEPPFRSASWETPFPSNLFEADSRMSADGSGRTGQRKKKTHTHTHSRGRNAQPDMPAGVSPPATAWEEAPPRRRRHHRFDPREPSCSPFGSCPGYAAAGGEAANCGAFAYQRMPTDHDDDEGEDCSAYHHASFPPAAAATATASPHRSSAVPPPWHSRPSTPLSPPSQLPRASYASYEAWSSCGGEDLHPPSSPLYRHRTPSPPQHGRFSAAAPPLHRSTHATPYAPSSAFSGHDGYPFHTPVRQSSRVEVLSTDTDGTRDHGSSGEVASADSQPGRGHHLESID